LAVDGSMVRMASSAQRSSPSSR